MTATHTSRQKSDEVFVELIGLDGLAHHVGPFKTSKQAEEWIERNSSDEVRSREKQDQKVNVVVGGNVLLKPTV